MVINAILKDLSESPISTMLKDLSIYLIKLSDFLKERIHISEQ